MSKESRPYSPLQARYGVLAAAHEAAKTPAKQQATSRPRKHREADATHYGALADAARQQAVSASWDRPMRAAARGKSLKAGPGVKLHPGWDAAFKRARAS